MHAICALDFILHCPCSDIYSNESTKLNFNFPGLSGLTIIRIQDLQELENEILKFYDFFLWVFQDLYDPVKDK